MKIDPEALLPELRLKLASLNRDIDEMLDHVYAGWDAGGPGGLRLWWLASTFTLRWRVRRWALRRLIRNLSQSDS